MSGAPPRTARGRRTALVVWAWVWACASLAWLAPPAQAADEQQLKAAIVFRLLGFVDWPSARMPASGDDLVLCVEATHALAAPLRQLARQPVRQWRLEVRPADPTALLRCHVWVGQVPPPAVRTAGALLVISDRLRQADGLTHVWLVRDDDRVGFELDLGNARRAGLQISARLSRLAREVHE